MRRIYNFLRQEWIKFMLGTSSLCIEKEKKKKGKKKGKREKKKVNSEETIISVDRTRGNIGKLVYIYIGKFFNLKLKNRS